MILNLFGVDGEALAKKYWDPIAKFFGDIVDSVLLIFTDPVAGIKKLFATLWGAATGIGAWIYDIGIKPIVAWLKEKFEFIGKGIAGTWTGLVGFIKEKFDGVITFLTDLFTWPKTPLGFVTKLIDIILLPYNLVINFLRDIFGWGTDEEGKTTPFSLGTFIVDTILAVVTWVKEKFAFAAGAVIEGWTGLKTFIVDAAIAVKDWIVDKFTFGKDAVIAGWNGLVTFVTDLGVKVWTWFKDLFSWGTQGDGADGDDKTLLGYIIGIPGKIWTWFKGLFSWGTQGDGADGEDTTLLGYIAAIPGKIWGWIKGIFSFTKPTTPEGEEEQTLWDWIKGIPGRIWKWFKGIFTFGGDEKQEGEETTTLWGWLKGIPGRIWNWIKGIFGFGETDPEAKEAGKGFSLWSIVTDSIAALGKWFADLFDIDWSQLIADMTPKWVKDLPFIGKWFGGTGEVGDAVINEAVGEHGQTLKGAKEAGLYDEDAIGASEINKEALQQGVKSGAVQKEMLQAIIDDKDLRDEDLAFMKTLVEQATTGESLHVRDIGLHRKLDTLIGMSSNEQMNSFEMKAGRDFAMNAMRLSMISQPPAGAGGGGSSTVMITNAPSTSNVANTKVETAAGVSDPHTQL
ncbi:MAG: hypothetical protein QF535_19930, partial [Anaerolineales bacterium]|nr:hypothetical protein [Anaerolineales bacterium]